MSPPKILLGHLGSFGDCLYATTIARQIKSDFPGCHLTWAIGSMYRSVIDLNPYVDDVWEFPVKSLGETINEWKKFEQEVLERKSRGDYDDVFLTQILPGNIRNYDGTIRSSTFRNYPNRITEPVVPVLRLSNAEVENVRRFAVSHRLAQRSDVILFECMPNSGQSSVTHEFAREVARRLIAKNSTCCVILSSNMSFSTTDERIIDGSVLSFRENAELTKYCSLLVGCSSGITWLCTADWAKPLPMIQIVNPDAFCFASVVYDHKYFGLPADNVIEMSDPDSDKLTQCIVSVLTDGFETAKSSFHETVKMSYRYYENSQAQYLHDGEFKEGFRFLLFHIQRHGFHIRFILWPFFRIVEKVKKQTKWFWSSHILTIMPGE